MPEIMAEICIGLKYEPIDIIGFAQGYFTGFVKTNPTVLKEFSDQPFNIRLDGVNYNNVRVDVTPVGDQKAYLQFMINREN